MSKLKVYTVGPISGQSYDAVVDRYKEQTRALEDLGYRVFCPMTGKTHLRTELAFKSHGYDNHPVSCNHAIKGRDRWMVGQSDILLADLTQCGGIVSIGSVCEIAWGNELKKQVVVVMEEGNIHEHCFILECATIVFRTMNDAYEYLKDLNDGI